MNLYFLSVLLYIAPAIAAGCNGDVRLCDRLYSNVTQIGAHDSPFVGPLLTENQGLSVTDQLNAGIRYFEAQTHNFLGTLFLCHTYCWLLNVGPLKDYLTTINNWLAINPNEVVTLLLTNGDGVPVSTFGAAMDSSGLTKYAYTPPKTLALDEWPTLQELIDSGKRLVTFLDSGANTQSIPYILDEFTYYFETPFDTTDATFNQCEINRPSGASAAGRMSIVNHFLDVAIGSILVPDQARLATTNSAASIEAQASLCTNLYGITPNVVFVDHAEIGQIAQAQNDLNHF